MSLPSVIEVAKNLGIELATATAKQEEAILVAAMRKDLPLAVEFLHQQTHQEGEPQWFNGDPNSPLGKQLIRINASDALRPLAEEHFCHGKKLFFLNCCGQKVGGRKPTLQELNHLQIQMQDGNIARADC